MMNFRSGSKAFALFVLLSGLAGAGFAAAAGHEHGHGPTALSLDHGSKWATDATLRTGMANIGAAMAAARPAIHAGRFSAADYGALATQVEHDVGVIIAGCKLPSAADAQLHIVLTQVVEGIGMMRGDQKTGGERAQGADTVMRALNAYAAFFDDPAFASPLH